MKASGGRCEWDRHCQHEAVEVNSYIHRNSGGRNKQSFCATHVAEARELTGYDDDRYSPLLLATVGDELYIALECAFRILAGDNTQSVEVSALAGAT